MQNERSGNSMASSTEAVVERTVTIDASPETVWQFLVDPDKTTAWWGMTASFDPRPGGAYRIEVIRGHTASGEFVELDAPRRLVYTFGWEAAEGGRGDPEAEARCNGKPRRPTRHNREHDRVEEHLGLREPEGETEQSEPDGRSHVQMRRPLDQNPEPERGEGHSVCAEDPRAG